MVPSQLVEPYCDWKPLVENIQSRWNTSSEDQRGEMWARLVEIGEPVKTRLKEPSEVYSTRGLLSKNQTREEKKNENSNKRLPSLHEYGLLSDGNVITTLGTNTTAPTNPTPKRRRASSLKSDKKGVNVSDLNSDPGNNAHLMYEAPLNNAQQGYEIGPPHQLSHTNACKDQPASSST